MKPTRAKGLVWGLVGLAVVLFAAAVGLAVATPTGGVEFQHAFALMFLVVFATIGGLIAWRHPQNPLCWIFCGVAVAAGLGSFTRELVEYWLAGGPVPDTLGETAAVYSNSSWIWWVLVPATFMLLLFPDGKLPSPRWRVISWCAGLGIAGVFLGGIFLPKPIEDFPQVQNPYALALPDALAAPGLLLSMIGVVGSALSLIVRYRRAGVVARQQIKWLAFAGAVAAPIVIGGTVGYDALGPVVAGALIQGSVLCLPIAAGIAILRYRLYDIDVVVNRTLVYGALTATLATAYFGGALVLQLALNPLTQSSELAVAGSTLAVAALFRPVRARIQRVVDRHFYRNRYDAARTLETFSGRLREQLDLQAVADDLRAAVRETLQPGHISIWLAPSGEHR